MYDLQTRQGLNLKKRKKKVASNRNIRLHHFWLNFFPFLFFFLAFLLFFKSFSCVPFMPLNALFLAYKLYKNLLKYPVKRKKEKEKELVNWILRTSMGLIMGLSPSLLLHFLSLSSASCKM